MFYHISMMPSSIVNTSSKHIKTERLSLWGICRWLCLIAHDVRYLLYFQCCPKVAPITLVLDHLKLIRPREYIIFKPDRVTPIPVDHHDAEYATGRKHYSI